MSADGWVVHKFGGSSLADEACIRRVAATLRSLPGGPLAVVVSAVGGVTDALLGLIADAERNDPAWRNGLQDLRTQHEALAGQLLDDASLRDEYSAALAADCGDIADVLHAVSLMGKAPGQAGDLVAGFGEIWSARLLATHLRGSGQPDARWQDAREILRVIPGDLGVEVLWDESAARLAEHLSAGEAGPVVITGFIARDADGVQTTLGRDGSDYSASIFAALLHARELHIWSDVPGVMSADPRLVPEAAVIDSMSYNEAMELAYFGARIIHPQTLAPVVARSIPLFIRNTFDAAAPGTRVSAHAASGTRVKGITAIDGMALINVEGSGMIGVPGTASRLFGTLREAGISVVLISQASSEHSICLAVPDSQARSAERVVRDTFAADLDQGRLQAVTVSPGCSILAVVGDGMAGTPGVAAKVFGTLGRAGINVRAIAQGASERNISAVIAAADTTRALRAVHAGFYLSSQTLSIGLIGPGSVGGVLLDQMAGEVQRLARELNLDLRVRAIASSRRMLLAPERVDLQDWRDALESGARPLDWDALIEHVDAEHLPHSAIIDCTADASVAARYAEWMERGIHVITPNKKAGSAALGEARKLRDIRQAHFLYETTVGAGLPIIHTLRDLRETGDRILRIQGILSGTLAYLLNLHDGTRPFSEIVRDATRQGYTEPDPRDDLSGMDVARKVVILGREMGLPLELEDIPVESLVPEALSGGSIEAFLDGMTDYDGKFEGMLEEARGAGQVLRYVGRLEADGTARVGLERFPREHAFANINLTDNIVLFQTARYSANPLIVQGPGAGPEVTAGGVFADLLRLAAYLGARL